MRALLGHFSRRNSRAGTVWCGCADANSGHRPTKLRVQCYRDHQTGSQAETESKQLFIVSEMVQTTAPLLLCPPPHDLDSQSKRQDPGTDSCTDSCTAPYSAWHGMDKSQHHHCSILRGSIRNVSIVVGIEPRALAGHSKHRRRQRRATVRAVVCASALRRECASLGSASHRFSGSFRL